MTPHVPPTEHREPLLTIHQPPLEDLAQIDQIAGAWAQVTPDRELVGALTRISHLVLDIQRKLGEPNEAAIQAARQIVATGYHGAGADDIDKRWTRDLCAAIISAQLRGPAIVEPQ